MPKTNPLKEALRTSERKHAAPGHSTLRLIAPSWSERSFRRRSTAKCACSQGQRGAASARPSRRR